MGLGIAIILTSMDFVENRLKHQGEFYGLLLFSILGMNVMAQSRELLTAYIALELLSFSLYVMVSYTKNSDKTNESALKYILVGAVSSAILLYGVSMVYSTLGVTKFDEIAEGLARASEVSPALWVGVGLILVGLMFKVSAVPFHMWIPDVYHGALIPTTLLLNTFRNDFKTNHLLLNACFISLLCAVFYWPWDVVGAKYIWWTWHTTDNSLMHRNLGVFTTRNVDMYKLFCQLFGRKSCEISWHSRSCTDVLRVGILS